MDTQPTTGEVHDSRPQLETAQSEREQQLLIQLQQKEEHIKDLQRKLNSYEKGESPNQVAQLGLVLKNDSFWNVPRQEVRIMKEIGRGASGLVCKGQFRGQLVAVKQIHQWILTQQHVMNEFKREVRIMASVQHPNLVRFIGAVFDNKVELQMATPLLLLELLDTNLRQAYEQHDLGHKKSLSIFIDIAYGLHYLHEHLEPIIHRDVSAPNVLLEALPGDSWRAKLSDFGSANFLKQSKTLGVGAIVYTAPEMFPREDPTAPLHPPTAKSDVFSYGIMLAEVIMRTMPTTENRHQLLSDIKLKWKKMYDVIVQCTQVDPKDRPTMADILNILHSASVI